MQVERARAAADGIGNAGAKADDLVSNAGTELAIFRADHQACEFEGRTAGFLNPHFRKKVARV